MLNPSPRQHPLHLPLLSDSRLTYRRLRRPTPLPSMATGESTGLGRYLQRLNWLFGH